MNQSTPSENSAASPLDSDAISRRAYELWENQGREEGNDLRHWLQAEEELKRAASSSSERPTAPNAVAPQDDAVPPRPPDTVGASAPSPGRANRRGSAGPFGQVKNGSAEPDQGAGRRKPGR